MKFSKAFILILVILQCAVMSKLIAQPKNASPFSTTEANFLVLNDSLENADSSLTHFEQYKPLVLAQDLGNIATPYRYLYWNAPTTVGFETGWYTPWAYYQRPNQSRFYKTSIPYTVATYVSGQRPGNYLDYLQQVKFLHTQNWGPYFNIGLNINSNRCNGFSTNAEARTSSAQLFAWFRMPNNRYQILASANFNSASNKLNGGIVSDSSYEYSSGITREIQGLILDSSLYRNKVREYSFRHFYRFGKETQRYETRRVKRDSTTIDTIRNIETSLQIGHSMQFQRSMWDYRDNIHPYKNYFSDYYIDTLRTKDTLHQNTLSNLFDLTKKSKTNWLLYAGLAHKIHWMYQYGNGKYLMNEGLLYANIQKTIGTDSSKSLVIKDAFTYCFFNTYKEFTQGDYLMNASAKGHLQKLYFNAQWIMAAQAPNLLQVYNPGNHFYWYNQNFSKTTTNAISVEAANKSGESSLRFQYANIGNYIYYNTNATPTQTAKLNYLAVFWKQDFKFKFLHYSHQAVYQKSSDTNALSLPKLALNANLMYDDWWFKRALHIQFGVSTNYFTKYAAPAFMPSINVFYEQHEKQIGNYWQLNGFVNLQIQRVRIFLLSEHLNQGMNGFGTASYITPHYPLPNRAFRFGVSWSFYN